MAGRIRSLASDTIIYGFFTVLGKFLSFLLTPFYAHYLTKEEVGDVTTFFALVAFLNVIYTIGMDSSFFRFYSKDDPEETRKVYTHSYLSIGVMAGVISSMIFISAPVIAPGLTNLQDGATLIMLASFIPFFDVMTTVPFGLLRMKRKAKQFSLTRFLLVAIAVGLNILFIAGFRWGAKGVFAANLTASFIGNILFLPSIIKYLTFKIDFAFLKEMLRFGLPTVPASFSSIILQVADRPILKFLTDASQTGMYTLNYRLGIPMMILVSFFEYAWKPFYLGHHEDRDAKQLFARVLTYFTLICALCFLVTAFFMEYVAMMPLPSGKTSFVPPAYWSGMGIVPIVLAGYYFNGVYINLAAGFHITKNTKYLPIAIGTAAIANVILNFILIPLLGYYGAAWATLGAYALSAGLLYKFMKKIYPVSYEWNRLLRVYLITGILYSCGVIVTANMSVFSSILIKTVLILVFVFLLFIFGFFTKDETSRINNLFRTMRNKA